MQWELLYVFRLVIGFLIGRAHHRAVFQPQCRHPVRGMVGQVITGGFRVSQQSIGGRIGVGCRVTKEIMPHRHTGLARHHNGIVGQRMAVMALHVGLRPAGLYGKSTEG
ncbi:hypothetical protein D3C75_924640 [compost metagenome]